MKKIFYLLILFSIYGNAQNYMSTPYPVQQPVQQGGDLYLAQRVLIEKQRRYNINWEKLKEAHTLNKQFLKGVAYTNNIDYSIAYNRYIDEYWNKIMRGNYDISSNSTLEYLIDYLTKGVGYIVCIELKDCTLHNN